MVQMISESKRKIAALALAGAMAIGGAAGVATTIASPAQNQSGIVMEAEAATNYSKTDIYYSAGEKANGCINLTDKAKAGNPGSANYDSALADRKVKYIAIAPDNPYTIEFPATIAYYTNTTTKSTTYEWVLKFVKVWGVKTITSGTTDLNRGSLKATICGSATGYGGKTVCNKVKFSTTNNSDKSTSDLAQSDATRVVAYYAKHRINCSKSDLSTNSYPELKGSDGSVVKSLPRVEYRGMKIRGGAIGFKPTTRGKVWETNAGYDGVYYKASYTETITKNFDYCLIAGKVDSKQLWLSTDSPVFTGKMKAPEVDSIPLTSNSQSLLRSISIKSGKVTFNFTGKKGSGKLKLAYKDSAGSTKYIEIPVETY